MSEGPVIAAGLCLLAGGDVRLSDGKLLLIGAMRGVIG